jgi:hypothetical protein
MQEKERNEFDYELEALKEDPNERARRQREERRRFAMAFGAVR